MSVRVRFAPSPTGYLHVGGARTALYNYLFAKKQGGVFIVRVEDTDQERSTEESMKMQLGDLERLGLIWDEGPHPKTFQDMGQYGPYRQSQRLSLYERYAQQLLESGAAYYDFRTDQQLEAAKEAHIRQGGAHQVPRPENIPTLEEARARLQKGERGAVRFKVTPEQTFKFKDLVRGEVEFPTEMVGDFVLLRSSGMPVYNFCCVVDDALMKITHVFRAEEHLSNTLRQMMLYDALGFVRPEFGHLSVILGADRQKLSKRHGATSVHDYLEEGFLPEALLNFIALLGWSSATGEEILSVEQMAQEFDGTRLHHAAAIFDEKKLRWMNATHLRALPQKELEERLQPVLKKNGLSLPADETVRRESLELFKTSMETLNDAVELYKYLSDEHFELSEQAHEVLGWEATLDLVRAWKAKLESHPGERLSSEDFITLQEALKNELGVKGKFLFMPLRVAVIGRPQGPELKELTPLLGKESLLYRAQKVLSGA